MNSLILRASRFADMAHYGLIRKWSGEPYITHPMRVAFKVSQHPEAVDTWVAAAWLHDVVEDTPVDYIDIRQTFGIVVADLVDELTNIYTKEANPELNRAERKAKEFKRISGLSRAAKIIKLSDRIDNLNDSLDTGFAGVYLEESKQLADVLADADVGLHGELCLLIHDLSAKYVEMGVISV